MAYVGTLQTITVDLLPHKGHYLILKGKYCYELSLSTCNNFAIATHDAAVASGITTAVDSHSQPDMDQQEFQGTPGLHRFVVQFCLQYFIVVVFRTAE